jgi:hypothetical protein
MGGPLVRVWRRRARSRAERELSRLVQVAGTCQTRADLERALGAPQYAFLGNLFRRAALHFPGDPSQGSPSEEFFIPDLVESYAKGNCVVELWFREQRVAAVTGFVQWSVWDLASGLAS